jgi:hypothetical protein
MRKTIILLLLSLVLLGSVSSMALMRYTQATSNSFILTPIQDTYVESWNPSAQFWWSVQNVSIGLDAIGDQTNGWFQFNISSAYTGTITITSATVSIYAFAKDYGSLTDYLGIKSIAPATEGWNDHTITWSSQPSRYTYYEANDGSLPSLPNWITFNLYAGNSTQGIGALQDAYDNNRTKSYCINPQTTEWGIYVYSSESSIYKPRLTVYYDYVAPSEPTTPAPMLSLPELHTWIYYPIEDTVVSSGYPALPWGNQTTSQISYSSSVTSSLILKFNLANPDLIDGLPNNNNLSIVNLGFDMESAIFAQYCQDPGLTVFNTLRGIARAGEGWSENLTCWNNKPSERGTDITSPQMILINQAYNYSIIVDEDFMRYSIQNNYTYSIYHEVDQSYGFRGYNYWYMREWNQTGLSSYLKITAYVELGSMPTSTYPFLTFSNAPEYLARQWSLYGSQGVFIAGHILCLIVLAVIVVPIGFITRKKNLTVIVTMGCLVTCTAFGWLHIGIFAVIMILTVFYFAVAFER